MQVSWYNIALTRKPAFNARFRDIKPSAIIRFRMSLTPDSYNCPDVFNTSLNIIAISDGVIRLAAFVDRFDELSIGDLMKRCLIKEAGLMRLFIDFKSIASFNVTSCRNQLTRPTSISMRSYTDCCIKYIRKVFQLKVTCF